MTEHDDALPPAEGEPPSLADARRAIATCDDLPLPRRRSLASSLSGIALICGVDASQEAAVPLTCEHLNPRLFRKPPAAYGFTPQRYGNIISDTRFVMRRLGRHAPDTRGAGALSPAWQARRAALPHYRQLALAAFMGFCSQQGIAPAAVRPDTLASFDHWLRTRTLCEDPAAHTRRAASNWNWARDAIPGWPDVRLERPGMRDTYSLPLTAYPASFQADVALFLKRLAAVDDDDLYDDAIAAGEQRSRRARAARPRTLQTRDWQIRAVASALVQQCGLDPAQLTSLADLVTPIDRVRDIIRFHRERTGKKQSPHLLGIMELLRQVAKHHCRLPPAEVARIGDLLARVRPEARIGMTDKNRERLRQLIARRAQLLTLPEELLRQAQAPGLTPAAAARLVAYAVALEILLIFPMRRSNLAELHLDDHLRYLDPARQRLSHIIVGADTVKNRLTLEWPIPEESTALIRRYLAAFRPHLADPANRFLFPGPGLNGRSAHELAIGLSRLVAREIGAEVNLHLLRHFAGWLYLHHHPGQYEVVRQMLGHRQIATTINFYTGLEADAAARQFDRVVLQERQEARLSARAQRFGRRRSGGAARGRAV
jgi:integrase